MTRDALSAQLALLPEYLGAHLLLTLVALGVGIAIALPLGLLVTRVRVLQGPTLTAAGVLQTIPGLALLALMVPLLGRIGFLPAALALILYSFLPILRNTVTGVLGVDPSMREAARGIGMTDLQMLFRVELPLALPVVVAGIRTAAVWIVGTATLATPVGATSLGNYIFSGLQTQNITAVVVGCIAAASLAVVLDQLIGLVEMAAARRSPKLAWTALLALLILVFGATTSRWPRPEADSAREPVHIGSKPFTEQYILARLLADWVGASGRSVENHAGMGSALLFEALKAGAVDCYVDYSGTIWTNVMHRADIPDRNIVLNEMTGWLEHEHGIVCLGPLGFENTYALAVRRSTAERFGLTSIEDLARIAPRLTMGSDYEFFQRPEWLALKQRYGLEFAALRTLDPTLMYSAIETAQVDVISAYSTDGRIALLDLVVLSDPGGALPPYDAVLLLSKRAAAEPELRARLAMLVGKIDDEAMREANRRVDLAGEDVQTAADYLRESSL